MARNLDLLGGLIHSQRVLLALVAAGMSRERAYAAVQRHAMQVWAEGGGLLERLKTDADVTAHIPEPELEALFDLAPHMAHVDAIFARVFGR